MNRVGWSCLGKPLQQGFRLRMVGDVHTRIFQGHGKSRMRQDFNRVSGFKVALADAGLAWELPARSDVIDERIVECFRDLMADCGYVLKSSPENPRRNPAGIIGDPPAFRRAKIGVVSVETQHAAAATLQWII